MYQQLPQLPTAEWYERELAALIGAIRAARPRAWIGVCELPLMGEVRALYSAVPTTVAPAVRDYADLRTKRANRIVSYGIVSSRIVSYRLVSYRLRALAHSQPNHRVPQVPSTPVAPLVHCTRLRPMVSRCSAVI